MFRGRARPAPSSATQDRALVNRTPAAQDFGHPGFDPFCNPIRKVKRAEPAGTNRLLCQGCLWQGLYGWRAGAAPLRTTLAGHAPVAQSKRGAAGTDPVHREVLDGCRQRRLERIAHRRHGPARGWPMATGHASHQIGLDVDVIKTVEALALTQGFKSQSS